MESSKWQQSSWVNNTFDNKPYNLFEKHFLISYCISRIQYRIAKRGAEMLAVGGKMVYSTCSLNPVENEAVLHRLLLETGDSMRLVDCKDLVPGLIHSNGKFSNQTVINNICTFLIYLMIVVNSSLSLLISNFSMQNLKKFNSSLISYSALYFTSSNIADSE